MFGAPGLEDPEIGLVGFAGGRGFRGTDEIVGFLDQVFEARRSMREVDEFVLHGDSEGQVKAERAGERHCRPGGWL